MEQKKFTLTYSGYLAGKAKKIDEEIESLKLQGKRIISIKHSMQRMWAKEDIINIDVLYE